MGLSSLHIIGAVLTLVFIVCIGIFSGKWVKGASDFATGGKRSGAMLVMGGLTGTVVGGSSTIGTAQLSFNFGLSAWWFTLGSGIACLVLGLVFVKVFRNCGSETIQQIISKEYGMKAGVITAVLGALGMLLNLISQLLSFNALLLSVIEINPIIATFSGIGLMICYVAFGGILGVGILGIVKLSLLYFATIFGGFFALNLAGGFFVLYDTLPTEQFFNFFARGVAVDLGAGLSLVLGVLSTQIYMQVILSAKTDRTAQVGALLSAFLIPPIGAGGILVGQYMRITYPDTNPALAFPRFIIEYFHPFFGGVALAALLIAVTGTGAGIALGISNIITNNIYLKFINKNATQKRTLLVMRILILFTLMTGVFITIANLESIIMGWGFMSMALRAAVLFVPMCAALILKERVSPNYIIASSLIGLGTVIVGHIVGWSTTFDPLFLGIGVGVLIVAFGVFAHKQ